MSGGLLKTIKAELKGIARRQRDRFLPDRATRDYRLWISRRLEERASRAQNQIEPGLLSIVTAVWDGSPLPYFRELASSVLPALQDGEHEWFVVSNGCSRPELVLYLDELATRPGVTIYRAPQNLGIIQGLRLCLERAGGRYILPVDADDKLYPDALQIVTTYIRQHGYPPLLYTDEDKISAEGVSQPYLKPDWDPVLLANSAYIAHLGVVDRLLALELGAYSERSAEGSPDWDLFIRFLNAGYSGVHIPEIVYSWRIHSQSTADDVSSKPYIRSSQEAVMKRFLQAHAGEAVFAVESSTLFGPDAAHLAFVRQQPSKLQVITLGSKTLPQVLEETLLLTQLDDRSSVGLIGTDVTPQDKEWWHDALGLFDLFRDAVMVGGRILDESGTVVDGPQQFGFAEICGCPDAGRKASDPGYFGQMWKQRSVCAVSAQLTVVRVSDLVRYLRGLPAEASTQNLGCWIGALAQRDNRRVIYSPYLCGVVHTKDKAGLFGPEAQAFLKLYPDLLTDHRYYPAPFSRTVGYELIR